MMLLSPVTLLSARLSDDSAGLGTARSSTDRFQRQHQLQHRRGPHSAGRRSLPRQRQAQAQNK